MSPMHLASIFFTMILVLSLIHLFRPRPFGRGFLSAFRPWAFGR